MSSNRVPSPPGVLFCTRPLFFRITIDMGGSKGIKQPRFPFWPHKNAEKHVYLQESLITVPNQDKNFDYSLRLRWSLSLHRYSDQGRFISLRRAFSLLRRSCRSIIVSRSTSYRFLICLLCNSMFCFVGSFEDEATRSLSALASAIQRDRSGYQQRHNIR